MAKIDRGPEPAHGPPWNAIEGDDPGELKLWDDEGTVFAIVTFYDSRDFDHLYHVIHNWDAAMARIDELEAERELLRGTK